MDVESFIIQMKQEIEQRKNDVNSVGNFKKGNVDPSWYFYHVVQQTYRNRNYLLGDVGWYYHKEICNRSSKYGVLLVCQVVMPNHIHEVYYTEDVRNISKLRQVAARTSSNFMKRLQKQKNYEKIGERLFERNPGYIPIKDSCQILTVLKYIKDNDKYLRAAGSKAPYSCFDDWDKKNYKDYAIEYLEALLDMNAERLNEVLKLDSDKVHQIASSLKPRAEFFRNNSEQSGR